MGERERKKEEGGKRKKGKEKKKKKKTGGNERIRHFSPLDTGAARNEFGQISQSDL